MRINAASIAYSWLMAICFLGLISVWTQPPATAETAKSIVELSTQLLTAESGNLEHIKATAWCALESNQIAVLKTQTMVREFRGSMAIAPEWRGEPLQKPVQNRLENCIALRLEQTGKNRNIPGSERAALAFLFSDL